MNTKKISRTSQWVILVYLISFLCYTPLLLQKQGIYIPEILVSTKYFFVLTPIIVSFIFIKKDNTKGQYSFSLFMKWKEKLMTVTLVFGLGLLGLLISFVYSYLCCEDLFTRSYPSALTILTGGLYLFLTALVEEIAWRGYLLRQELRKHKPLKSFILVGIIWGIWHLPMWTIRNSEELIGCALLFIWTILVGIILGITFALCENILLTVFLHTLFNLCYIAPIQINIVVLGIVTVLLAFWHQLNIKITEKGDGYGKSL